MTFKEKVIEYCTDEGILGKKIVPKAGDNNLEFGYELKYPPGVPKPLKIIVLKLREKNAIMLQVGTTLIPKFIEALNKNDKKGVENYLIEFKKHILAKSLNYNVNRKNKTLIISDFIYEDGLTEHRFYKTLQRITNAVIFTNTLLMERMGGKIDLSKKGGDLQQLGIADGGMFS